MTTCYDDGALRTYVDGALPADEHSTITAHLAGCRICYAHAQELETLRDRVGTLLATDHPPPDPKAALARLHHIARPAASEHAAAILPSATSRRIHMETKSSGWLNVVRRPLFAGIAALIVVLGLLALPPVRAAADQLLQIFRVQQVIFMPISEDRIQQLENLKFEETTLFVAPPKLINQPAEPKTVDTAQEAGQLAGFAIEEPANLPSPATSTTFRIQDRATYQFQVDVETSRQLLTLMNINDVTIPDELGAQPIVAEMPTTVESTYRGPGYDVYLIQGHSPQMTLPDGVDLAQLGKAALRLLGMDPIQAETLSKNVDWSSTLIIPFPSGMHEIQQVMIGDAHGMMVGSNDGSEHLYWQRGDRFYVLNSRGNLNDSGLIAIAESIK